MADREIYTRNVLERIDQAYKDESIFVARTKLALEFVSGQRCLDLGCGTGNTSIRIAQKNSESEILAVDLLKNCVEFCREKIKPADNVSIARMEGCNLAIRDDIFDCVVALDLLEHIEQDEKAMMEILRIMAPSGKAVLTVPAIKMLYGKRDKKLGHYRRYSKQEIEKKMRGLGFKIEKISYWNTLALLPFLIYEKILGRPIACPSEWEIEKKQRRSLERFLFSILMKMVCLEAPIGLSLLVVAVK